MSEKPNDVVLRVAHLLIAQRLGDIEKAFGMIVRAADRPAKLSLNDLHAEIAVNSARLIHNAASDAQKRTAERNLRRLLDDDRIVEAATAWHNGKGRRSKFSVSLCG